MSGRPCKLTKAVHEAIIKGIRAGMGMKETADLVGITYDTLQDWIQRGEGTHPSRKPTPQFVQLVQDFKKARADHEEEMLAAIQKAALGYQVRKKRTVIKGGIVEKKPDGTVEIKGGKADTTVEEHVEFDWKAAAWQLERKYPDRYGRKWRKDDADEGSLEPKAIRTPLAVPEQLPPSSGSSS